MTKKLTRSEIQERADARIYKDVSKTLKRIVDKHGEKKALWAIRKFDRELVGIRSAQKKIQEMERELSKLKRSTAV